MKENTTKITITKASGTGVLTKMDDGRWDISVNGSGGGSLYYTQDQVEAIIAKSTAAGDKVVCE